MTKHFFNAWNETLLFLIPLAKVHIQRVILTTFATEIEKCPNQEAKSALKDLCDLYALDTITQYQDILLEKGYYLSSKSIALKKMMFKLIKKINERGNDYVDAFGIPRRTLEDLPMMNQSQRKIFSKL